MLLKAGLKWADVTLLTRGLSPGALGLSNGGTTDPAEPGRSRTGEPLRECLRRNDFDVDLGAWGLP